MLVDEYLKNHAPQNDPGDVVALILSLAYTTVGRSYAIAELSDPQQRALEVLFALGLIFRRKETSSKILSYVDRRGRRVRLGRKGRHGRRFYPRADELSGRGLHGRRKPLVHWC